jgi:hypothetical protein
VIGSNGLRVFADFDNDGDRFGANNIKGESRTKEEPRRTAQLTGPLQELLASEKVGLHPIAREDMPA